MDGFDIEIQYLDDQLTAGEITQAEYNRRFGELERERRDEAEGAAQEAADRAYRETLQDWY